MRRSQLCRVLDVGGRTFWAGGSMCKGPEAGWGLWYQSSLEGEGVQWAGRGCLFLLLDSQRSHDRTSG